MTKGYKGKIALPKIVLSRWLLQAFVGLAGTEDLKLPLYLMRNAGLILGVFDRKCDNGMEI